MVEKDLRALFMHQLKHTYFAENAITKALPKLAYQHAHGRRCPSALRRSAVHDIKVTLQAR